MFDADKAKTAVWPFVVRHMRHAGLPWQTEMLLASGLTLGHFGDA